MNVIWLDRQINDFAAQLTDYDSDQFGEAISNPVDQYRTTIFWSPNNRIAYVVYRVPGSFTLHKLIIARFGTIVLVAG
jgi:hypothetical protein